jgi:hypothetical protein
MEQTVIKMPPPRIITLVEQIKLSLNSLMTSYKSGLSNITPDEFRKTYNKHFSHA